MAASFGCTRYVLFGQPTSSIKAWGCAVGAPWSFAAKNNCSQSSSYYPGCSLQRFVTPQTVSSLLFGRRCPRMRRAHLSCAPGHRSRRASVRSAASDATRATCRSPPRQSARRRRLNEGTNQIYERIAVPAPSPRLQLSRFSFSFLRSGVMQWIYCCVFGGIVLFALLRLILDHWLTLPQNGTCHFSGGTPTRRTHTSGV